MLSDIFNECGNGDDLAINREHRSLLQVLVAAVWNMLVPSFLLLVPDLGQLPPALFQRHAGLCVMRAGNPLTEVQQCWVTLTLAFKLLQRQVEKALDLLVLLLHLPGIVAHVLGDSEEEPMPKVLTEPSPDAGLSVSSQL